MKLQDPIPTKPCTGPRYRGASDGHRYHEYFKLFLIPIISRSGNTVENIVIKGFDADMPL